MMQKLLFCCLLTLAAAAAPLRAQQKPKLPDCRKYPVQDSDKRDFLDRDSFVLDADGDGKPDTVTSRTYAVKIKRRPADKTAARETHWIAFDLKTNGGRILKSFFKFKYGTNEADDSVYALVRCSQNGDAKPDLLFYAGDEQGDETIILVNGGGRFTVYSRKYSGELPSKI